MFKIIVATDKNRGIGYKGKLPWHVPSDLKYYKETTSGMKVVYGSTTFNNLPKIENRNIYVIGNVSNEAKNNYKLITDINKFITEQSNSNEIVWICGGERTYKTFLPYVSEIHMSIIKGEYTTDTHFPTISENFELAETKFGINYNLEIYRRK